MSKSVYEIVTERIIEQLENGVIPWEKPWTGVRSGAFNRVSKKSYSLLNQMLLKHEGEYATFKQWSDLGGHIRKGEKSEMVVFWKILPVEEEQEYFDFRLYPEPIDWSEIENGALENYEIFCNYGYFGHASQRPYPQL